MLLFDSDDLARTEDFLSAHYAPMRIGSTSPRARARISRAEGGPVTIDHLEVGFEMRYDVSPLHRICLCEVVTGAIADHAPAGERAETFGAGELFSLAPPDRPYRGRVEHARYRLTMLDPALLDRVATPARGEESVRLRDHRPVSEAAARALLAAIDHLDDHVLADPDADAHPLLVANASRYVAAHVINTFPTTAAGASPADSRDAHPATLRRAIAYLEAHADADIAPADVAAAAHVSVRALQLAFRRHLDTTPTAYLRDIRLARVRQDLLDAQPGSPSGPPPGGARTTVAGVAARWGFAHQGHFGALYRRRYGETPGQTLRRPPGPAAPTG